jgi:choline dehydrogenase-like flavoprotein
MKHSIGSMKSVLEAGGAKDLWVDDDTSHLMGGCRMGDDPNDSVVDKDGRSWSIPNLWVCDGSLFPTSGGVNPSLTIQANALRIGDRIKGMAARGEL